jgi:hypothetical protein
VSLNNGQLVLIDQVKATPTQLKFGSLDECYYDLNDPELPCVPYTPPQELQVTVRNIGEDPVTLTQPFADTTDYEVGSLSTTTLGPAGAPGDTATFTVRPVAGLQSGESYPGEITIDWELEGLSGRSAMMGRSRSTGRTVTVSASFAVKTPPAPPVYVNNFTDLENELNNFGNGTSDVEIIITQDFKIEDGLKIKSPVGADVIIKGDSGKETLTRDKSFPGNLFTVEDGARLIFESIIIDGDRGDCRLTNRDYCPDADPDIQAGSLVYVNDGHFIMRDTEEKDAEGNIVVKSVTLQNNGGLYLSGGAVNVQNGTFTMEGGKIIDNTAFVGSGVYLSYDGEFTMVDGQIGGQIDEEVDERIFTRVAGNEAYFGGGVYIDASFDGFGSGDYITGGKFIMTGGVISGNTAIWEWDVYDSSNNRTTETRYGGDGVYVIDGVGTFVHTGGVISDDVCWDDNGVCRP